MATDMNSILKALRLVEDHAMLVVNELVDVYPDMNDCPGKLRYEISRFLSAYYLRRMTLGGVVATNPAFPSALGRLVEITTQADFEHMLVFWLNAEELAKMYEIEIQRGILDEFIKLTCIEMEIDLTRAGELFHEMVVKVRAEKKSDTLRKWDRLLG